MDVDALAACKGRHFGVSNFTLSQFALLHRRVRDAQTWYEIRVAGNGAPCP